MSTAKHGGVGNTACHLCKQSIYVAMDHLTEFALRRSSLDPRDQIRTGLLDHLYLGRPQTNLQCKGAGLNRPPGREDGNASGDRCSLRVGRECIRIPGHTRDGLDHGHQNTQHTPPRIAKLGIAAFQPGLLQAAQSNRRRRIARQQDQSATL